MLWEVSAMKCITWRIEWIKKINYSPKERAEMSIAGYFEDTPGRVNVFSVLPTLKATSYLGHANYPVTDGAPTAAQLNAWMAHCLSEQKNALVNNDGAIKRHKLCNKNTPVKFIIELNTPVWESGRLLPPGTEIQFRIHWNTPQIALQAYAVGDANIANPRFTIVPNSPKISIKALTLQDKIHLKYETDMLEHQKMALYPHNERRIMTITIPNGLQTYDVYDVFTGKKKKTTS